MVPAILTRVLGHGGEKLSVRDAVLEVSDTFEAFPLLVEGLVCSCPCFIS